MRCHVVLSHMHMSYRFTCTSKTTLHTEASYVTLREEALSIGVRSTEVNKNTAAAGLYNQTLLSLHSTKSRGTRWKPDQSDRRMCWRRRWRTSKHGSGRRKEPSRNPRSSSKSKRNFRKSNFIVDKSLEYDILI